LLQRTGRRAEAIRLLEQAVASEPSRAEHSMNLGAAYLATARINDALAALERAIALDETSADAHYNLGVALAVRGRADEAIASYERCLALDRGHLSALNNLAELKRQRGQLDEALALLDRAIDVDPQFAVARYNRALVWLAQGRLAEGWEEYEWRLRCEGSDARRFDQPAWDGSPLPDKTLLLTAEQGLGDTLQFIRYLPLVTERCRHVVVEVPARLIPLLEASGFKGLVAEGTPLPRFHVHLPLLSLGRVFGTTLETIPGRAPYLAARPNLVEPWRAELARLPGLRVGIVWQGRASYRNDAARSIPLAQFAPLAKVAGVRLIGLQKGPGVEQISAVRGTFQVVDLGSRIDGDVGAFMDTAAIMKNLDLVITSDTAAAHLAGALGVDVWLALDTGCDWRWLVERTDCPWYPTMRIFRQRAPGDWSGVFRSMADELAKLAGAR
jgi:cytochrome c-type biogenesis protein CcmH/NrfG